METSLDAQQTGQHTEPRGRPGDRLRNLELEQTRLLARHESVVAQLSSLRSTLRGMERLMELRMQRLEKLGGYRAP